MLLKLLDLEGKNCYFRCTWEPHPGPIQQIWRSFSCFNKNKLDSLMAHVSCCGGKLIWMKDLQLSGRSSAEFSSRILKLTTSPLTILHPDLSSFLQANLSKPKNLPGTVQTFFRLRGFSAPKTPRFPGQKHHRLRKQNTSSTRCTRFSYPIFFLGGVDI